MRLREIVEPEHTIHAQDEYQPSEFSKDQANQLKVPSGFFSYVDTRKSDPHEIDVHGYYNVKHESKIIFYKEMSDLMGSNPYMPIVYNIDQFSYDSESSRFDFNMERLLSYRQLDNIRRRMALESVVADLTIDGNCISSDVSRRHKMLPDIDVETDDENEEQTSHILFMLQFEICDVIDRAIRNPSILPSRTHLSQFCQRLNKLTKADRQIEQDFHPDNALFRRTQHGAQFVIADPVVSKDELTQIKKQESGDDFGSMASF